MKQDLADELKISALILRILSAVFGFVWLAMGVALFNSVWNGKLGMFGDSPWLIRLIGGLFALALILFGGFTCLGALSARYMFNKVASVANDAHSPRAAEVNPSAPIPRPPEVGYACSQCGAPLAPEAEVSPLGDVKCTYCQRWFNIHQA